MRSRAMMCCGVWRAFLEGVHTCGSERQGDGIRSGILPLPGGEGRFPEVR